MPVVCNDRCPGYVPQFTNKVAHIPVQGDSQLLLNTVNAPVVLAVQDIPVVMRRLIPMVSLTMEIHQLLFDVVIMSLVWRLCELVGPCAQAQGQG